MGTMQYLSALLLIVFVISVTDANYERGKHYRKNSKYGKGIPPPPPRPQRPRLNFDRITKELRNCRYTGLTPCFREIPVRCFSKDERCNGPVFCNRYHDDELGCNGNHEPDDLETRTFTVRLTSTKSAQFRTTTTTHTTTQMTSSMITSTFVSLVSSTSTTSVTPRVHPSNSETTQATTSEIIAIVTTASPIAGVIAGPGNACENLAVVPVGGVAMAPANIFMLTMGNAAFAGSLTAFASCTQTSVKIS